jgi:hypothetical protein
MPDYLNHLNKKADVVVISGESIMRTNTDQVIFGKKTFKADLSGVTGYFQSIVVSGESLSSSGITFSGIGAGVGSETGYVDSKYLNVETHKYGLELIEEDSVPTVRASDMATRSSNELVIEWTIPSGFKKGALLFPDSYTGMLSSPPSVFTQLVTSGSEPITTYTTSVSGITVSGFTLELSARSEGFWDRVDVLVKATEPTRAVAKPNLGSAYTWEELTKSELEAHSSQNTLIVNRIYYITDTNRMHKATTVSVYEAFVPD